jgi:hypothetical protein
MLRVTRAKVYNAFRTAGPLYLRFLRDKSIKHEEIIIDHSNPSDVSIVVENVEQEKKELTDGNIEVLINSDKSRISNNLAVTEEISVPLTLENMVGQEISGNLKFNPKQEIDNTLNVTNVSNHVIDLQTTNSEKMLAYTKPTICYVDGNIINPVNWSWAQLFVAIVNHILENNYLSTEELKIKSQNRSGLFLYEQKPARGVSYKLSNGLWLYTTYDTNGILKIIKMLCAHCEIDLNKVIIGYKHTEKAQDKIPTKTDKNHKINLKTISNYTVDSTIIEKLKTVIIENFQNMYYRLDDYIDSNKFRNCWEQKYSNDGFTLPVSDKELDQQLMACGITFEKKVYIVSDETKEKIMSLASEYFESGAKVIFYSEFYSKNENWLNESNIVSIDMLVEIFRQAYKGLNLNKEYFGYTSATNLQASVNEILRVWDDDLISISLDTLVDRLRFIPRERITQTLNRCADFIKSSDEIFTQISRIKITDEQREYIINKAVELSKDNGFFTISDLSLDEIMNQYPDMSELAVQNALFQICLSDKYKKRGKFIYSQDQKFNLKELTHDNFKEKDQCLLSDILSFMGEFINPPSRQAAIEYANAYWVQIDKGVYVSEKLVNFDVENLDNEIDEILKGSKYLPLKSFCTIIHLTDCGYGWNQYLLESYCRRFSSKFQFITNGPNSHIGIIAQKDCKMSYKDIVIDALTNAPISSEKLDKERASEFLLENGYANKAFDVESVLEYARANRKRGLN